MKAKILTLFVLSACAVAAEILQSDIAPIQFQLMDSAYTALPVLTVKGVMKRRVEPTGHWEGFTIWFRPQKPEECVVDLWTKDGRHWIGHWTQATEPTHP